MNAKFFDLKQEKQDRMINAILKVFAENGYQHASTDDIVAEAHISKGLLFHYFESKLGAYSFAYDYVIRYITLELSTAIDPGETSFFEIKRQIEAAKMQSLKSYPYAVLFLDRCNKETVTEAILAVEESKANYEESLNSILAHADMSVINNSPDNQNLITMLDFTLSAIVENALRDKSFNAETNYKESVKFINLVEKNI